MIEFISVDKLWAHPHNPRKDLGDLAELTESIKTAGILQNLTVVPWFSAITGVGCDDPKAQEDMGYTVVIGHRRLAAAKLAGLTELPCSISDMCLSMQVATMLLENMQRSDLTIVEQANGIQMMLDLGETVSNISEKTGFSESTVRRRVKLLDLDKEKFRKSVARGATLQDYAELDKIHNLELKNKVLDTIGTPNFNWTLQNALRQEKQAENKASLIASLEGFATQVDNRAGLKYIRWFSYDNTEIDRPADADETKYYYMVESCGIQLFTDAVQTEEDAASAKRQQELQERRSRLGEITKTAFQLRYDFIKNLTGEKKHTKDIMEFAARAMLQDNWVGTAAAMFVEIMGIELDEDNSVDFATCSHFSLFPERALLVAAYCMVEDKEASYYQWNCQHEDNEALNLIYGMLVKLGYEMSDEEQAMFDGTHSLFVKSDDED